VIEMPKKRIHVVPTENGWAVKREGQKTPLSSHRKKDTAEGAGRAVAKREETELVIHKKDGTIGDTDSFGNDPNAPKDKKH